MTSPESDDTQGITGSDEDATLPLPAHYFGLLAARPRSRIETT